MNGQHAAHDQAHQQDRHGGALDLRYADGDKHADARRAGGDQMRTAFQTAYAGAKPDSSAGGARFAGPREAKAPSDRRSREGTTCCAESVRIRVAAGCERVHSVCGVGGVDSADADPNLYRGGPRRPPGVAHHDRIGGASERLPGRAGVSHVGLHECGHGDDHAPAHHEPDARGAAREKSRTRPPKSRGRSKAAASAARRRRRPCSRSARQSP